MRWHVPGVIFVVSCAACGGDSPSAPSTAAVTVRSVSIEGAAPAVAHRSTHQLRATSMSSNGTSSDCSSAAAWASSNPSIASIDERGLLTAAAPGDADVRGTCGGVTGTAHIVVSTLAGVSVVADWGVDPLRVGVTGRIRSFGRSDQGFGPCAADEWRSSDPQIAGISPDGSAATVSATKGGEATISATCAGISGTARVRVSDGWTVRPFLYEAPPIGLGLIGSVEVLDGPKAGTVVQGDLAIRLYDMQLPVRVRAAAPGYQPTELTLTMQGSRVYESSNTIETNIPLRPIPPPPGTDEFIATLNQRQEAEYRLRVGGEGRLRALVWFALDYNDFVRLSLECDGQPIQTTGVFGDGGTGIEAAVRGAADCKLRARADIRYPSVTYRLRVSYPH